MTTRCAGRGGTGAAAAAWQGGGVELWLAEDSGVGRNVTPGLALDASGRILWQGRLERYVPAGGADNKVLQHAI